MAHSRFDLILSLFLGGSILSCPSFLEVRSYPVLVSWRFDLILSLFLGGSISSCPCFLEVRSYPVLVSWRFDLILSLFLGGNVYFYEETPLYVYPGQCVNFAARSHFSFFNDTTGNLQVTWKKDTRVLNNTGKWLNITYARASDSAFYQVEVKNKRLDITEETLFWLNVQECRANEKEMPGSTTKCKTSCVEMCPAGWSYLASSNGNRCYKYFGEPKSWLAARDSCQNIGSQLAVAGNEQENSFIGSLVKSAEGSWIGLNDRISESTFLWNYEKTNSYSFTAWAANEPNNYNAKCNIENCVVTNSRTGQWADVICNSFYPFVCQRSTGGGM
eukprot:gene13470-4349_t